MSKCLYCYQELEEGQKDFHPQCARKFFGVREAPLLEYRHEDLDRLAEKVIRAQTSLTGVQPKLSLNLDKHEGTNRLTIVGLWGDYILKPQTESYPQLPENEDQTMHLAEAAKISVKDKEELALPLSGRKSQLFQSGGRSSRVLSSPQT